MRAILSPDDVPSGVFERLLAWMATGSSYICSPPVNDTDRDFVVLVHDVQAVQSAFLANGWTDCLAAATDPCTVPIEREHSPRLIVRKGELNIIVVDNKESFDIWRISTKLAKRFNLLDKVDRVDLFSAIRDRFLVSEE